jgi:hypothetical protein
MRRSQTVPVSAPWARRARWAITALVAVALPATAHARIADSLTPPDAARAVASVPAPRAAIPLTQLAPGSLAAVAATSATNAWAVGNAAPTFDGPGNSPLILHWDGSAWLRQVSPALPFRATLGGIAARSPSDAWAVGNETGSTPHRKSVILHWNGSGWRVVATPVVGLSAVAVLSARNAWAVGSAAGRGGLIRLPVALHWNGRVWKRVRLPKLPTNFEGHLNAVSASSPRNIWAVGSMTNCGCGPGESLLMHWNGRSWKRQTPPAGACCFSLTGVAAISSRRAFAVGGFGGGDSTTRAQAARFNGRRWRRQHTPSPGFHHVGRFGGDFLDGVAATSSGNAWAVGSSTAGGVAVGAARVLVERWNGRAWRQAPVTVTVAGAGAHTDGLSGVAATAARNAWAVGAVTQTPAFTSSALILHWNGATWSAVPTAP